MRSTVFVSLVLVGAIAFSAIPQRLQANELPPLLASTVLLDEQGVLESGDSVLPNDGSFFDVYSFEGNVGQIITIDVESNEFDPFLLVFDKDSNVVGNADDISEENTNARLTLTLPNDGVYRAIINGYNSESRGRYRVTIQLDESSAIAPQ